MTAASPRRTHLRDIPRGIWALGFVSMLMDISSEMIHALLPVYLMTVLGTSAFAVGVIEGVAESTASIMKVFSGALSDRLGQRKWLAALGYGLAAATKPIFPLAPSVGWLIAARFIDRVGKGIRGAPRDALVADIAPAHLRGASFGLRQSLDTVGAFLGPALAIGLMWLTVNHFQTVFWIAVIPAVLSVVVIVLFVKEPARHAATGTVRVPLGGAALRSLGTAYWITVAISTVFTLARFSEAFLILKAQAVGLPIFLVPLVLVLMNIVYALTSYPIGVLSDRMSRIDLLALGLVVLIAADLVLGLATGVAGVACGVALWGLHMGCTQGVVSALVADTAPAELRGTAFGVMNLLGGVMLLIASILAGLLWDRAGAQATFLAGAGFSVVSLVGIVFARKRLPHG